MPVAATRLTQPHMDEVQSIGLKVLYERAPVACAAALLSGFSQGAFWGLGPVWADISQLGTSGIAWFMTLTIIGGALFQWPIGQLTNHLDRGHVISVVALGAAVLAGALLLAEGHKLQLVLLAGFIYGGLAFTVYPLAVARMMDRLDKREIISGCGSLLLLHGIGATIGPLIAGSLMHHFGPQALPGWFITVQLSLAATAWAFSVRAPADLGHQRPLTPMVRTTPGVMEMLEIPLEAENPGR
jgi:MFS family permease